MNIDQAIAVLEDACEDPRLGLPEKIFLFLTRLTPMVNVDLLIKDDDGRTLLTWRDDIYGLGWHLPGGIIRLKETAAERITATAMRELGCQISAEERPIEINEGINKPQSNRGHSISLLYRCKLTSQPSSKLESLAGSPKRGMFGFFDRSPRNLLPVHRIYRKFID